MKLVKQLEKIGVLFLDTAPVIYFVEQNPEFASKVKVVFERLDDGKLTAVVSPIHWLNVLFCPISKRILMLLKFSANCLQTVKVCCSTPLMK